MNAFIQMEEEQSLINELKKIEARKRDRERKTQDLQKLISQADSQGETPRKSDKKIPKKKLHHPTRPSRIDPSVSIFYVFGLLLWSCMIKRSFQTNIHKYIKVPVKT